MWLTVSFMAECHTIRRRWNTGMLRRNPLCPWPNILPLVCNTEWQWEFGHFLLCLAYGDRSAVHLPSQNDSHKQAYGRTSPLPGALRDTLSAVPIAIPAALSATPKALRECHSSCACRCRDWSAVHLPPENDSQKHVSVRNSLHG